MTGVSVCSGDWSEPDAVCGAGGGAAAADQAGRLLPVRRLEPGRDHQVRKDTASGYVE